MEKVRTRAFGDVLLLFGSFPPVLGPTTDRTVALLDDALGRDEAVVTASPRPSGARLQARVTGAKAGARLDMLRRRATAKKLHMMLQPGVPIPLGPGATKLSPSSLELLSVSSLTLALARFDRVILEPRESWTVGEKAAKLLWSLADEVVLETDQQGDSLFVPERKRVFAQPPGRSLGPAQEGVTAIGPPEVSMAEMPRFVAGRLGRRILGPTFPLLRALTLKVMGATTGQVELEEKSGRL